MRLVIISHTEHYKMSDGTLVGWGPTINEINHLAPHFKTITHVAMLYNEAPPKSSLAYTADNINFVAMPALGGKGFKNKLKIIVNSPKVIAIVNRELRRADAFQLRTPTGVGVFLIPYLTLFSRKKGWYKYAGNWNQKQPPLGYRLQRWFLKLQQRKVTINGSWPKQPQHCLTFENPCLTEYDLVTGKAIISDKKNDDKLNFCYVGRLETPKGVGRIIDAIMALTELEKRRIGDVHLVGDGVEKSIFESKTKRSDINFKFHGYLERDAVFEIYKKSHFFLMPTTASEGFPKVIAEASNFGCIPIVSGVSAIAQYIFHRDNGFIIDPINSEVLSEQIMSTFEMRINEYQNFLKSNYDFVKKFTFNYYNNRILKEILK